MGGFRPYSGKRWLVAAALSAAVTSDQPARNRALLAGANCLIESSTRTPAAFRVGARGRGLSLKGRLPRNLSRSLFSAGRGGSVSRRDLNRLARNRALLAGATCLIESSTRTPAAFRVGARGRGLSLKGRLPRNLSRSLFSAGRGGSVSRRDLNQPARNRALLAGANCLIESSTRTPAAFRVEARGRGLSLKGRLPRNLSRSLFSAGRGGSVSRRDLNRLARNRALLAGATCLIKSSTRTPAAFRVGARGRGLSLKGRLPRIPLTSPSIPLSLRCS